MPTQPVTPEIEREVRRMLREVGIENVNFIGPEGEIPPDAGVAGDNRNPRRRERNNEQPEVGTLVQPEPRHELDLLVLHEDCKRDILDGLRAIQNRAELDRVWGMSQIQPMSGRCILNFYGDPGTGKTRAALAIARRLGKPLYQVDYASIISKYLGDTAKHIATAFERAAALGAVLFLDEADSLLSKRVDMNESCATSINQNRNVLMQCLDRFDGVVIMTTNLFANYDAALLRRIAKHIEFKLPNRAMRVRLFELHLPRRERVEANLVEIAKASKGLGGGDVFNVCFNSMLAGSTDENPENWKITQAILEREIEKAHEAKKQHTRKRTSSDREAIGFAARNEAERELEQ